MQLIRIALSKASSIVPPATLFLKGVAGGRFFDRWRRFMAGYAGSLTDMSSRFSPLECAAPGQIRNFSPVSSSGGRSAKFTDAAADLPPCRCASPRVRLSGRPLPIAWALPLLAHHACNRDQDAWARVRTLPASLGPLRADPANASRKLHFPRNGANVSRSQQNRPRVARPMVATLVIGEFDRGAPKEKATYAITADRAASA